MAYPKKFVDIDKLYDYCLEMSELKIIPNPAVIIPKELYDDMCKKIYWEEDIEVINENSDGTLTVRLIMERSNEEKIRQDRVVDANTRE